MKPSVLLIVAVVLVGCGRPEPSRQAVEPTSLPVVATSGATDGGAVSKCPMMMPGATASEADVDRGAAITFTTSPDGVAALRTRVRQMAEQQSGMAAGCPCRAMMGDGGAPMPGMMRGMTGDAGMPMHGMMGMRMPPAEARVEDVENGARLTLTAKDPADTAALRAHVRMHIEHMKSGGCPMM